MKKCASCTKDLPDAALHCVFCGAKQPPAPVASAANAKTVMGYGGQELDALRAQAQAANAARGSAPSAPPSNLPAASPYSAPRSPHADAATVLVSPDPSTPRPHSPSQGGYGAGAYNVPGAGSYPPPNVNPPPPGGGYSPPGGGYSPPGAGGYSPPGGGYGAGYNPQPVQPVAPIPTAQPPYLASQPAARAGRPIEPWKDSIRVQMFIWGGLLLAAFCTPLSLDPLAFNWDTIINAPGKAKLLPLLIASIGLLSIVVGAIPMESAPRGVIAMVLGLSGMLVPMFINGMPPWDAIVIPFGLILLVPALLVRNEYRDSSLPRILVTVGALVVLVPLLIPQNGDLPIVVMFQAVIDMPGQWKILTISKLMFFVIVVLSLLAWIPSPSSGAAKPIAWALLLWPAAILGSSLFLDGGFDPTKAPFSAWKWLVEGWSSGFLAIAGYGTATVIGKQLE